MRLPTHGQAIRPSYLGRALAEVGVEVEDKPPVFFYEK